MHSWCDLRTHLPKPIAATCSSFLSTLPHSNSVSRPKAQSSDCQFLQPGITFQNCILTDQFANLLTCLLTNLPGYLNLLRSFTLPFHDLLHIVCMVN